ncbi:MAG: hypothetical protein ACKVQB_03610 [Bacteroidia bacterium]
MNKKIILIIFLSLATLSGTYAKKNYGYKDKAGNYKWFDDQTDTSFIDGNNREWTKVTGSKEKWNKAIIIRNANIYALLDLGFDTMKVLKDVQLLSENSILFTRFSKLENFQDYVLSWKNSFNSNNFKFSARKSAKISKTDLSLKFYDIKANIANAAALGLVKRGFFEHFCESGSEIIKKYRYKLNWIKVESYLKNYMHLNNAIEFLNEKKLEKDIELELLTR